MSSFHVPTNGQVNYFLADDEIPVGNSAVIAPNTLFALYNIGQGQYQLITKETAINVNAQRAQELSQLGTYQPQIKEHKKMKPATKKNKEKGILEAVLFEVESVIAPSQTDPVNVPDVSLDQKVDRYLVRYEREAIPTSAIYNTELLAQSRENPEPAAPSTGALSELPPLKEGRGILFSLLFEAPEDEPLGGDAPAPDAGGGDLFGGGDPLGGGDEPATEPSGPPAPPVVDTPKMNLNAYCRAIARLINNYEALLNPKTTIFMRAKEYLRVNYDEATAKMFEEVMEKTYDMTAQPEQRDTSQAPHGVGGIYDGGGGSGGVGE